MSRDRVQELFIPFQQHKLFNQPNSSQQSIFKSIINWLKDSFIKGTEYMKSFPNISTNIAALKPKPEHRGEPTEIKN